MGVLGTTLLVLGIVALLESLIILTFPKWTINLGRKWMKPKPLKKTGWIELIIAVILILVGMNL